MLQKKGVVDLILKLFPRQIILLLREKWEEGSAKHVKGQKMDFSDEEKAKVQMLFANDELFYEKIFSSKQILTGSELISELSKG